jgi:putative inorganic carbon (hco3(-)) transporter
MGSQFLFNGLLVYTVMFFTQIAGRLTFLEPIRIELVVGSILLIGVGIGVLSGKVNLVENKVGIAAFCLVGAMLLSIPFAFVKTAALATFIEALKVFAIYLMIVAAIDSERKLKIFMFVFIASNTILIVEPFYLSLFGEGYIYNNHMLRLAGTTSRFGHPNALGMIAAASLPFYFHVVKGSKSAALRLLCASLMLISIRVIMLTQSRTAFVGFLVFAGIVFMAAKRKARAMVGIVCVLIAVWMFAPEETQQRFETFAESYRITTMAPGSLSDEEVNSLGSMSSRLELMKHSFEAFIENPLFGLGLECFSSYSGRRWGVWLPPHNTYLQVMAETGLVGTFALLMLILYTFRNLKKAREFIIAHGVETSTISTIVSMLSAYYTIWLVVSFFGIELYNNFWWVTAGLSIVILRVLKMRVTAVQARA